MLATPRAPRKYTRSPEHWQALLDRFKTIRAISRETGINRGTVYYILNQLRLVAERERRPRRLTLLTNDKRQALAQRLRTCEPMEVDWSSAPLAKAYGLPYDKQRLLGARARWDDYREAVDKRPKP